MKLSYLAGALSLTILLAACGQKTENKSAVLANETAAAPDMPMGNGAEAMGEMPAGQTATGKGTVKAINPAAGTMTIDHGPIPEANWPAMTMAFAAKPAVLQSVKVGDAIVFDLALKGGAGEVIAARKQ